MTQTCCGQGSGEHYDSPELKQKMLEVRGVYLELAREFTRLLNDRGISGSVIQFSVHNRPLDEILEWLDENEAVALGWWTCPPDCVCCGLGGRFLTSNEGARGGNPSS